MAVKFYRCSTMWAKMGSHPCWRVQKELNAAGVDYEVVKGPVRRSKRSELEKLSGQRLYPVIQFEDGTLYRDGSKAMAERIRAGKLGETAAPEAAPAE